MSNLPNKGRAVRRQLLQPSMSRAAGEKRLRIGPAVGVDFEDYLRRDAEQTARIFTMLARHGWYPDLAWWSGQVWELAQALENGSRAAADDAMCQYVDVKIASFEEKLCGHYPRRSRFIVDALGAHRDGKYTLSVPALLAQTDGICSDTLNTHLCKVQSGKLRLADELKKVPHATDYGGGAFAPLLDIFPIAWGAQQREGAGEIFNRHVVLHGESLDYDTRTRSSQAVMLLNYVGAMMNHAAELKKGAPNA